MIVPGITSSEADRCMSSFLAGEDPEPETHELGVGERSTWASMAESLGGWLETEASSFLEREDAQARYEFDAFAAEGMHRIMRLPGFVVASQGFWRYLNLQYLRDWIRWRHGVPAPSGLVMVAKVNYGCGSHRDDLASRLWFRGELGHAPERDDPYELVRRGGTDFWTSGLTRVLYPSARSITHALVEFRHPEPGEFHGSEYRPQRLNTDQSRELYKRLRHYDAILNYTCLTLDEARDFLRSIANDLVE